MSRHQQVVIASSLDVLRAAVRSSGKARTDTIPVRLALRCLLPHVRERWPLTNFWESSQQDNDIGRSQGCTAAFNGICRQLRAAGRYPDP